MDGRPEKFNAIVSAAKTLFWKHGIRRVTIEEICQEAGVSKMTCYKYFTNKSSIAIYLLEEIMENGMKEYHEIMNSKVPYEEKIRAIINWKLKNAREISQELVEDIYKTKDDEISKTVERIKNQTLEAYMADFRKAQKEGDLRRDIKPEFIIYFLNQLTDMITARPLVDIYPNPQQMIEELMTFFFYGIMARDTRKRK